jgi:CDP-diacylglycerol--glycerol-3-phosphate 3-phosphatidyltransferase
MKKERTDLWTASNVVSLVRIVLTVPIVLLLQSGRTFEATVMCFVAAVTDYVDGWLARRTHTVSEWGKIIDPVADKVLVGVVVTAMVWLNMLPLWFVVAVLARDLIILVGGIILRSRVDVVVPSDWTGKFTVGFIAGTGVAGMNHVDWLRDLGIVLSCGGMLVSLWSYSRRFIRMMHGSV